jgi:hypothetical protein
MSEELEGRSCGSRASTTPGRVRGPATSTLALGSGLAFGSSVANEEGFSLASTSTSISWLAIDSTTPTSPTTFPSPPAMCRRSPLSSSNSDAFSCEIFASSGILFPLGIRLELTSSVDVDDGAIEGSFDVSVGTGADDPDVSTLFSWPASDSAKSESTFEFKLTGDTEFSPAPSLSSRVSSRSFIMS